MGWKLSDIKSVPSNGRKVFTCFSCGGGSSMGYKLAGYDVIGHNEINPKMAALYERNLHPRHSYVMDIREFKALPEYPKELYALDILDGSPPCTTFSIAGKREDSWGVARKYSEGEMEQMLDDLFFHFLDVAARLLPKALVIENVVGLVQGNAKGYVNTILNKLCEIGYQAQIFRLDATNMGVPQKRERVIFICQRNDMGYPRLGMRFDEPTITFGEIRSERGRQSKGDANIKLLKCKLPTDKDICNIQMRVYGRYGQFNNKIYWDNAVAPTLTASGCAYRAADDSMLAAEDMMAVQTFPEDYDFYGASYKTIQHVCGMSVPPIMMQRISAEIYRQWFAERRREWPMNGS